MDKYAKAIEHLTEYPHEIYDAWSNPRLHVAGCLFKYAAPNGGMMECPVTKHLTGCLTQIHLTKGIRGVYGRIDLTKQILADTRIPENTDKITLETLPAFAEWQRTLDKELGRA